MATVQEVVQALADWVDEIDFTRKGKEESLGRDCADLIVEEIQTAGLTEHSGADEYWLANEPRYAAWKARKYGLGLDNAPNVRTGQMLSQNSLYGQTTIGPKEVLLRYGTGDPPDRSYTPNGYLSDADKKVTDIQKAEWAHTAHMRPFYAISDVASQAVVAECEDFVIAHVVATNAETQANGFFG